MKFLITVLLLTSLSVFAEDPKTGEEGNPTTEHVTQPCDGAVDDQVTTTGKTEGTGGTDAPVVPAETKVE